MTDPTQKAYVDAVGDFLETKEIKQPKVKIDNILRVDQDGDGEEEVLISATNYLDKSGSVPMRSPAGSYSMACAASHRWQSEDPASRGRIPSEGLPRVKAQTPTRASTRRTRTRLSARSIWTATASSRL